MFTGCCTGPALHGLSVPPAAAGPTAAAAEPQALGSLQTRLWRDPGAFNQYGEPGPGPVLLVMQTTAGPLPTGQGHFELKTALLRPALAGIDSS